MIGEDRTEPLDQVASQVWVRVDRRRRYACRTSEGDAVQAPALERPIDDGMATETLVAQGMVSKFCDSIRLFRHTEILKRQGIKPDRSTLSGWLDARARG